MRQAVISRHGPPDVFDLRALEDLLRGVSFEEAYEAVTRQIGNPPDREQNPGRGCIDPARTAAGLVEAGGRIGDVARSGGAPVFATGAPGALILYYLWRARWAGALAGETVAPRTRGTYPKGMSLDW